MYNSPRKPKFDLDEIDRRCQIKDKELLIKTMITAAAVLVLIFLTPVHHKDIAWVAIIGCMLILSVSSQQNVALVLEKVDWVRICACIHFDTSTENHQHVHKHTLLVLLFEFDRRRCSTSRACSC